MVIECEIIECEIDIGCGFTVSRRVSMLVMHDGQCRLEMKKVVVWCTGAPFVQSIFVAIFNDVVKYIDVVSQLMQMNIYARALSLADDLLLYF